MSWCWGKGTSAICWRITPPTTTGCARTLGSTRMRRSIDLRRQSGVSHQSLGSAVSIGTTFGWHNRYTQRRHAGHLVKIELEVDTVDQLAEALAVGVDAVLLDQVKIAPILLLQGIYRR